MATIYAYLTFNGNCREAMKFYKTCLGGILKFQTVGESPFAGRMPKRMIDCILHASLSNGDLVLMGTDMVSEAGLIKGNAISLSLTCMSESELKDRYNRLSEGGSVDHPIKETFWGAKFGGLTDKFGIHWLLTFHKR